MSNIMTSKIGFRMNKETLSLIKNGGKYGCVALGIVALYDLCVRAMEKGCTSQQKLDTNFKYYLSINLISVQYGASFATFLSG